MFHVFGHTWWKYLKHVFFLWKLKLFSENIFKMMFKFVVMWEYFSTLKGLSVMHNSISKGRGLWIFLKLNFFLKKKWKKKTITRLAHFERHFLISCLLSWIILIKHIYTVDYYPCFKLPHSYTFFFHFVLQIQLQ